MITLNRRRLVMVACALTVVAGWCTAAGAQSPPRELPNVVDALRMAPGVLGVDFPTLTFDRQPLPDLRDNGDPILTIVSVKPAENGALPFSSIGIELYGPLPGGVAAGGRFAPAGLKVPGLRDVPLDVSPR